ncbi:MAG: hypothetical protein Q4E22_04540 [Coriobacteriia bacterium]|nr:hypothetical protein [Coriobacteriia bacterium]
MAKRKQVNKFAEKWLDKFTERYIDNKELTNHVMGDDCEALGFKMDGGHAFSEKYGEAAFDYEALKKIINDVTDISLLGSAIHSRWYYFSHEIDVSAKILRPENRWWFIEALDRLEFLTREIPSIYKHKLKKMRIDSRNVTYGYAPDPDEEVEQRLIINNKGRVKLTRYNYVIRGKSNKGIKTIEFKIDEDAANKILDTIQAYFRNLRRSEFHTCSGTWHMKLTNIKGVTSKHNGSLHADLEYKGIGLSDLIRETLGLDDLFVFDGNRKPRQEA